MRFRTCFVCTKVAGLCCMEAMQVHGCLDTHLTIDRHENPIYSSVGTWKEGESSD